MHVRITFPTSIEAVIKAFVAGATLGMAASGLMEITLSIASLDWLATFREEHALDVFGWGGGALAVALSVFKI